MSLNAATIWEVRTTGNAGNGGGFYAARDAVNGIDYSQQDAAQLSLTDLAMDQSATTLTSATSGFTHAMEGNIIYIASGTNFDVGYYEIVTYTDTNTVTIDRTAAAGGVGSSGVGKVGGALISINTAIGVAAVSSNIVHVKSGTYAETVTFAAATDNLKICGYLSSRLDNPTGTDRPYIDATSLTYGVDSVGGSSGHTMYNFRIANATTNGVRANGGVNLTNVKCSNNGDDGIAINGDGLTYILLELGNNTGDGSSGGPYNGHTWFYCYGHDNGGYGLCQDKYNYGTYACFNIAEANANHGLVFGYATQIACNTAYNNTGAAVDGIVFGSGNGEDMAMNSSILNNNSSDNGRYGIRAGNNWMLGAFLNNAYYGNGSAGINNIPGAYYMFGNVTTDTKTTTKGALEAGSSCLDVGLLPA